MIIKDSNITAQIHQPWTPWYEGRGGRGRQRVFTGKKGRREKIIKKKKGGKEEGRKEIKKKSGKCVYRGGNVRRAEN